MESGLAATCSKTRSARRQLPITGSAHKAGIIRDACHAAVVASLDVAAEHLGSACNDSAHHAAFDATKMTGMQSTISIAMLTQDIGNLDGGSVRMDVGVGHKPHPDALLSRWRHLQR